MLEAGKVVIYTDGGAIDNPGPGGYGVVLRYKGHKKELSGGFRSTTNNRMELLACIEGLKALKNPCQVVLYLWEQLLVLCDQHDVEFRWARGHAGNPDNERCDQLAVQAASRPNLPPDTAFETGETQEASMTLFSM